MNIFWVDVETTGLNPNVNSIIELAAHVEIDGKIERTIHTFSKPYETVEEIDKHALEVNGHKIESIMNYPSPNETIDLIIASLWSHVVDSNNRFMIAGQCCKFDYDFLRVMFMRELHARQAFFDSLFSHHLIDISALVTVCRCRGWLKTDSNSLSTIAATLGIKHNAHQALSDINAARNTYYKLIKCMSFRGILWVKITAAIKKFIKSTLQRLE